MTLRSPILRTIAAALFFAPPALAGQWITPKWSADGPGKEPQFKPVPLYWFEVKE